VKNRRPENPGGRAYDSFSRPLNPLTLMIYPEPRIEQYRSQNFLIKRTHVETRFVDFIRAI
jgi:hypothetical protein